MPAIFSALAPRRTRLIVLAGTLLAGLALWFLRPHLHRANPRLDTPALVLERLQAKALYYNGAARPWLLAQRPDLLVPEDRDDQSGRARAFAQAVLEPRSFRQLDRQFRFDALLFIGDPSQYRPLLEHLAETKDWTLSYVDHFGMVFRRGGERTWKMEDLLWVRAHFQPHRPSPVMRRLPRWLSFERNQSGDLAKVLAQTAIKLVAVRESDAGKLLLDEAVQLDARLPEAWNGLAIYHMHRGEYREAFDAAERALALDKAHLPALATKTQLLFATKHFSEAYELSQQLIERLPDDPNLLFYHAKIAHEAHAYRAEVEVLQRLIAQAEAEARPVSGYQIYLGQAYASASDAPHAIEAFMAALNDPELPQEQRDFARENIVRIKKRTGL